MSQFDAPIRRRGGELDVYTGLLCVAFLALISGTILLAVRNLDHSRVDNVSGGPFKLLAD